MIKQEKYWIKDLTDNVKFINSCIDKKIPFCDEESDELLLELEKRIMTSCYIIRKLNESNKIPDPLYKTEVELAFYPKKDSSFDPDDINVENLHDMKNMEVKKRYFSYVANQIIHSYFFEIYQYFDETISGFYFNSDRSRKAGIYYVRVEDFFEALTDVSRVYAVGEAFIINSDRQLVKVWS